MKKMIYIKNMFSVVVATVLCITAFTILGFESPTTANADSLRTYIRHDYTNNNTPDYEYNLSVSSSVNTYSLSPATIFPPNEMVRDYDESVVRIEGDGVGGTGFIVGEHLIATAAHCVYFNGFIDDLTISIVNSNNVVIDTMTPKYIHLNKDYTYSIAAVTDYALIYVEEDLSDYGMFKMGLATDRYILRQEEVVASGFPSEYPDGYNGVEWGLRFKSLGYIYGSYSTTELIRHDADFAGGESGGPLYVEEGVTINGTTTEYKTVIGINIADNLTYNTSVRVTPNILKFVYDNPNITPLN